MDRLKFNFFFMLKSGKYQKKKKNFLIFLILKKFNILKIF